MFRIELFIIRSQLADLLVNFLYMQDANIPRANASLPNTRLSRIPGEFCAARQTLWIQVSTRAEIK